MGETQSAPHQSQTYSQSSTPDYYSYTPDQVLDNFESIEHRAPAFIKRFVKNLNSEYRLKYWKVMANPDQYKVKNPDIYTHLIKESMTRKEKDPNHMKVVQKISLDVSRTFPNDPSFTQEKQQDLQNVLEAFALLVPKTGYCQGMSFLAGKILLITNNAEDSLWIFTFFMKDLNLYGLFCDGMPLLRFSCYCVENVVKRQKKALEVFFSNGAAPISLFISQWLTALFSINFKEEVTLKIWDMFLLEGFVWLIKVCSAVLILHVDLFEENKEIDMLITKLRELTNNDEWLKIANVADGIVFGEKELKECKVLFDQSNKSD